MFTGDAKSCLRTERPHLCQGIGTPMSPFNSPLEPLKYCPGECRLAPCEIFEHELCPRCEQPPESRERRHWICEVVQCIGADDQIKGLRRVWEARCLTSTALRLLKPYMWPTFQSYVRLRQHVWARVYPVRFRIRYELSQHGQQDACPTGHIQHTRSTLQSFWHMTQCIKVNHRHRCGVRAPVEATPACVVMSCSPSPIVSAHLSTF